MIEEKVKKSGSIFHANGSVDPDLFKNETNPQYCFNLMEVLKIHDQPLKPVLSKPWKPWKF